MDEDLLSRIGALVEEEHRLEAGRARSDDPADIERIQAIEVMLDQAWDLLRRRRARRANGEPADDALRPADTVEHYLQ
jgi:hypothetical protein